MVGGTIAEAARSLVKTMWDSYRQRPFDDPKNPSKSRFSASVQDLIKAMMSTSPNTKSQKAITPAFLRYMAQYTSSELASSEVENKAEDHMTDIIIRAVFFAMRSCEYTIPKEPGSTITIRLGGVTFFDRQRKEIDHNHPYLLQVVVHVRILFEDQKNREKCETRTHQKSDDLVLCPVLLLGWVVQRVLKFTKNPNADTPLCAVNIPGRRSKVINQENTRVFMKVICEAFGGQSRFGFSPNEIGNRSVRTGAAMSLFLTEHSLDKIMLLGRWKSRTFLVYIRPQVTEWCDLFSIDMISFNNRFELFASTTAQNSKLKGNEIQRKDYYMPQYMCG